MDLKYRKLISRCKPLHKILKWYAYNSGIFFYSKLAKKNHYAKIILVNKMSHYVKSASHFDM